MLAALCWVAAGDRARGAGVPRDAARPFCAHPTTSLLTLAPRQKRRRFSCSERSAGRGDRDWPIGPSPW